MWWAKIKWIQKPKWDQSEITGNNTNKIRWRKIPTFIKVFNMSCQFNAVDDKRVATLQYNLKNCTPTKWSLTGQENLRTTSLLSGTAWQRKIKWQQQTSKLYPREKVPRLNTVPQHTKYASWIILLTRCYCTSTPLSLRAWTAPFIHGSSGSIISTSVLHCKSLYNPIKQYLFPSASTAAWALERITV